MQIKIHFHKIFQPFTKVNEITIDVDDFMGLSLALQNLFPNLKRHIGFNNSSQTNAHFDGISFITREKTIVTDRELYKNCMPEKHSEIWVVPCLMGGGGGSTSSIIMGLAFAAIAVFALPALAPAFGIATSGFGGLAASGTILGGLAKSLLGFGINLILSGIMQIFQPRPKPNEPTTDANTRRNNDPFDGLANTLSAGQPIPLTYGLNRLAGQFASGYIKTINHGRDDVIKVSDYV